MKIPSKSAVANFIKDAAENMRLSPQDYWTYNLPLTPRVALILVWEDGYDPEDSKTNIYVSNDGYGIAWSLRLRNSSYFTSDWDYLNEAAGHTLYTEDAEDGFMSIAENVLDEAETCGYLNPCVSFKLPGGDVVNLLDDGESLESSWNCSYRNKDLTELWWYYHGWTHCINDIREMKIVFHAWATRLADEYLAYNDNLRHTIAYNHLIEKIYNALLE